MGLTFQQKFYQVPHEVYLVQFLEPGDMESAQAVFAIIEKPEDKNKADDLEMLLEEAGYCTQVCDFDDLIRQGYTLLEEQDITSDERRKRFDIY